MVKRLSWICWVFAVSGCGVPAPPSSTGGVDVEDNGSCPGALAVVNSDYLSSNVAVLSPSGSVLSESMISSGSAAPGLSTALSGDVVLPSRTPPSGRLVLLDRYPNAVVTWLDPATADVIAQLSVATGFPSNPQDYLELDATRAYVSRLQTNPNPGAQPNDGGGDLLIVDTQNFAVTGRIDLGAEESAFLPSPGQMLRVGDAVWVLLERFDSGFGAAGDARLVGVAPDHDEVAWSLDLPGVANCGALALDPANERVAVACSGVYADADAAARSGVVLLDATVTPPVELARFDVASELGSAPSPSLAWTDAGTLLGVTYGDAMHGTSDLVYVLDPASGTATSLLTAGKAFVLGDTVCSPGCSDTCFVADAAARLLRSFRTNGRDIEQARDFAVDPRVGLPPRSLGFLVAKP